MRQFIYFLKNLFSGMSRQDAQQTAREEIDAEQPRLIDCQLDLEEWDAWPIDGKVFEYPNRQTILERLRNKPKQ